MRVLLEQMDSTELTAWQVFFQWRDADQQRQRKEREFLGDDNEVIRY